MFALSEEELGQTLFVTHKIDTKKHPAIKQQPRRTPFVHREKIIQLLNEMLKQKVTIMNYTHHLDSNQLQHQVNARICLCQSRRWNNFDTESS